MAKPLRMQVLLGAIDQATGPLRKITQGSDQTARALRASREQLRNLQQQQKDVSGYRQTNIALRQNERALRDARARHEQYSQALEQQRNAHVNIKGSLTTARREYDRLSRAVITAKEPNAALSAELEKARIRLNGQQQAFDKSSRSIKQYRDRTRHTDEQVKQLTRAHDISTERLAGLRNRLNSAGISTDNLGRSARQLRQQETQLNATLGHQQQRLEAVAAQQRRLTAARDQHQRTMGRVNRMAGVGAVGVGSGLAKGYAASRLLTPGVSWAEQMSTLQAVGRFSADDERYQALRAQSRELGGSTAFSATEVGAGQEFLLRAGMSAEAIQASMRDVLDLALANNTELGRAADIASNIAGAFKIDLEQEGSMSRVADILSGAASRANVNLEMLGETMKYLGGAEDLNLTMEQAAAMAGLLGNIGIQGSQAGTTMRAMMNRLTAPTSTAAGLMESYGIQVADVNGNMRDMPDILRDINAATAELGNVERKEVLQRIFGAEAGSGMAELVNSMAAGELDQLIAALGESYGENAEMARVMADNIGGDLKNMRSAWEEVGISVTDTNNGPLRELVQSVTRILRGVGDWIKANPELAGTIAKLAAGLIALVTIGGAITLSLASILGPLVMLRYGFALLAINGGGLIGTLVRLAGVAIPAVLAAVKGMAVFLATNPIGLAVAAIAAAVFLIIKYWEPISGFFRNLWNGVTELFGNAWQAIQEAFAGGIAGVSRLLLDWSPMGILWRGITAGLQSMGVDIPERFSTLGNAMIDGLMAGIDAKWQALKDKVGSLTDGVTGWFRDALGINSPSRVFAEYGGFTVDGFNVGLDRQRDEPAKRVRDIARRVATAGAGIAIGTAGLPAVADIPIDRRPALSAHALAAPAAGDTITINVYGSPGMDERTLAQEVARQLEQRERERAARQRSSLRDID